MKYAIHFATLAFILLTTVSCVSNKKFTAMQTSLQQELDDARARLGDCQESLRTSSNTLTESERQNSSLQTSLDLREEQIEDLRKQIADCRDQLSRQITQVGDLTVLSREANDNIKETLSRLEQKESYIQRLLAAKTKTDSLNLALAVNLKSVLDMGLDEEDVEVKVDKTVVFVNLSDKMLFQSGSANINPAAATVLEKISQIVKSRPELDVMVEGYTDNVPIRTDCLKDNWDLSVRRSTAVVRILQDTYKVDPNKLIAAGRGEYNTLVTNDSDFNRAINRRTRIILLPKLGQFYDLLNPNTVPK